MIRQIDRSLARCLSAGGAHPAPIVRDAMRYCVLSSGKRFRPLLCLGGCEAVGSEARKALRVACAVELIHTYSLVHDDLPAMDNAEERRGKPSCHRRFGEATAILVGDALLTLAFELLSRDGTPESLAIIRTISQASGTTGLIGGQALDLRITDHGSRLTAKRLEEIARRKTAALITASVVTGGLAGGASPRQLTSLRRFGKHVGLAFQIIDDLHDDEGFSTVLGGAHARGRALRLIDRATHALEPFGARAWVLLELADWLAES